MAPSWAVRRRLRRSAGCCGEYELPNGAALIACGNREIAAELQPGTAALLQVDAAVQDAALYASGDLPERIVIKGRGGTDFRPGFVWLSEQGLRSSCCLYLTDMKCDHYPEAEPDCPVIWCN